MTAKDGTAVRAEKAPGDEPVVAEKYADETLRIIEEHGAHVGPLTPDAEKALRRKTYWHVMGLLSAINLLLFVSRSVAPSAATPPKCLHGWPGGQVDARLRRNPGPL